jgi:hypothetical protein
MMIPKIKISLILLKILMINLISKWIIVNSRLLIIEKRKRPKLNLLKVLVILAMDSLLESLIFNL